jgi:hypothetical protein
MRKQKAATEAELIGLRAKYKEENDKVQAKVRELAEIDKKLEGMEKSYAEAAKKFKDEERAKAAQDETKKDMEKKFGKESEESFADIQKREIEKQITAAMEENADIEAQMPRLNALGAPSIS